MIRTIACPDESDLLALATEGVGPAAVRSHVDACPACHRLLLRLAAEIVHLRSSLIPEAWAAPAAASWPAPPGTN